VGSSQASHCLPVPSICGTGGKAQGDVEINSNVRFSNRQVRVKRFQTIHCRGFDVARGLCVPKNVLHQASEADIVLPYARKSGPLQDLKMPHPKDDPKSPDWRPYIFARDQWHCRICGDRFLYCEMVRKHIANEHDETMPPSMYEYFHGAVWQRKKIP
jgi:hypothetical protein